MGARQSSLAGDDEDWDNFVEDAIRSSPVVIFCLSNSVKTEMVKKDIAFERKRVDGTGGLSTVVAIEKLDRKAGLLKCLKRRTKKSLPIVYIGEELIGGEGDVRSLRSSGLLRAKIDKAVVKCKDEERKSSPTFPKMFLTTSL